MRPLRFMIAAVAALLFPAAGAAAAELVMFEQAGCAWCARFNAEIAPAYAESEEGRLAPLRRVDIHQPRPADLQAISVDRFTPTFVVVEDGVEYGRLRGYPGDEFFWFLVGEILAKLPDRETQSRPQAAPAL